MWSLARFAVGSACSVCLTYFVCQERGSPVCRALFNSPLHIFHIFPYFSPLPPLSSSLARLSLPFRSQITHSRSFSSRACGRVQSAVKEKINLAKGESGSDRKSEIQRELDEIRWQQSDGALNRGEVLDQLKALQEGIKKKVRQVYHVGSTGFSWARATD